MCYPKIGSPLKRAPRFCKTPLAFLACPVSAASRKPYVLPQDWLALKARAPFLRDPSHIFGLSSLGCPKETLRLGDPSRILLPVQAVLPQDWTCLGQVG